MDGFSTAFSFIDHADRMLADYPGQIAARLLPSVIFVLVLVILLTRKIIQRRVWLLFLGLAAAVWIFVGLPLSSEIRDYSHLTEEYARLREIYNTQQFRVAEGVVHVVHVQNIGGHDFGDILSVGQTELELDHFLSTVAYTTTIAYGGILREGVYARVYYCEEPEYGSNTIILRIDLRLPTTE